MITDSLSDSNKNRVYLYVLFSIYLLVYILPLGVRPLVIPDETRYAEIPREMIQSGDWTAPHLNGLRYFEKPPLGYWLNAVSMSMFGENAFAVRLPTALSAGASAFLVWLLWGYAREENDDAVTAPMLFLGMCAVLFIGTFATLDTLFCLFLTAGVVFFYIAAKQDVSKHKQRLWLLVCGAMFGLAFLTKGFLAFVIPGMVLLPWLIWEKHYHLIIRALWAAGSCLLTILPWALAIHFQESDFWRYFIWEEHLRRFMADNAQHTAPVYYYLISFPLLSFPWVGFIPAVISGLRKRPNNTSLSRLLLLWIVLPFLFFSVSKGKLATYILPCFAPLAVLFAVGLSNYLKSGASRLFRYGALLNMFILLLLLLAFVTWGWSGRANDLFYAAGENFQKVLLPILLMLSLIFTSLSFFARDSVKKIAAITVSIIPLFCILNFALPEAVVQNKAPVAFLQQMRHRLSTNDILITDGSIVRAVNWAFKRDDVYMLSTNELKYGLSYAKSRNRLLDRQTFAELIHNSELPEQNIGVFCKDACPDELTEELERSAAEHYTSGHFNAWLIRRRPIQADEN